MKDQIIQLNNEFFAYIDNYIQQHLPDFPKVPQCHHFYCYYYSNVNVIEFITSFVSIGNVNLLVVDHHWRTFCCILDVIIEI